MIMKPIISSIKVAVLIAVCCFTVATASVEVVSFIAPEGMSHNGGFTVKVRTPSHDWQDVSVYLVKVDMVTVNGHASQDSSMASFDFTGMMDVSITFNRETSNLPESARCTPACRPR